MVRKVSTSTMRDGSFPFGNGTGKPTLVGGHLPLKFQWITHTKRLRVSEQRSRKDHAVDHEGTLVVSRRYPRAAHHRSDLPSYSHRDRPKEVPASRRAGGGGRPPPAYPLRR